MGTCYNLIKIDKGEEFDLNKGFGFFVPFKEVFTLKDQFPDKKALSNKITLQVDTWQFDTLTERQEYIEWLTNNIWDWCGDDRLICLIDADEYDFYIESLGGLADPNVPPKPTGSRFRFEYTKGVFKP